MSPNPHDSPAGVAEPAIGIAIACNIAFDFCAPPLAIVFWPSPVFGAPVPKTTIDEYCGLRSWKNNVHRSATAYQNSTMEAEAKTTTVQLGPKLAFTSIVSLRRPRHPVGRDGRDRIAPLNISRHFSYDI
jgi:hypothetical protein